MSEKIEIINGKIPLMALRGMHVFPGMVMNFDVERPFSIGSVEEAIAGERALFLTAQMDVMKEHPQQEDLYEVGTVCVLRQFIRGKNNTMRVLVEGQYRARMTSFKETKNCLYAVTEPLPDTESKVTAVREEATQRKVLELFDEYLMQGGNESPETMLSLTVSGDSGYIADYIAQNVFFKPQDKQLVMETQDPFKRLSLICTLLGREVHVQGIEQEIGEKLHEHLLNLQKENVLREQMKVIQSELGDDSAQEYEELKNKILALKLPEKTQEKLLKENDRLARQPFGSQEASVLRAYIDVCLELPWNKSTKERLNIQQARKILERDHYGLEDVKKRIIEYLAVRQIAPEVNGGILCLVGPPGVGKTSIAISIADALGRKLARMSLGGVHDEAEIRGHRKTYVGSMPGRIINAINQSGVNNPLLLLDEIDKLGSDYRGDPSAALLEALDPEQNATFRDHFLEVPFDLSKVMFITTANTVDTIPRPLLDRMEIIQVSGYTDEEKFHIAKEHLLSRQRKKHGLTPSMLKITDGAFRDIIAGYTMEAGVRGLERQLGKIYRRIAAKIAGEGGTSFTVKSSDLSELLGVRHYHTEKETLKSEVGVVNGLAWTSVGGELLKVEAAVLEGTGKIELTGNLGDVMKESAHIAVSYLRSRARELGIEPDFYKTKDLHIHFPEGATPKDGPSAGAAITTCLASALTGRPVRGDIAMTGEISLRGSILPIGGLKEKTMAALRSGIHTVLIPKENERDLEEIDQNVRRALNFILCEKADFVLDTSLLPGEKKAEKLSLPRLEETKKNIQVSQ